MKIQGPWETRQTLHRYGMCLILLSGVFFALMSLGVRILRESLASHTLVFYRSLFQTLFLCLLLGLWTGKIITFDATFFSRLRAHVLRGTFGIVSMYFLYLALGHLPLGLANLLAMTSVLWAALLARTFLKERGSRSESVAALTSCVGVGITLVGSDNQGPQWSWDFIGVGAGLMCGLFMGMALTVLRHMRKAHGSLEIVFFFGICGLLFTAPTFLLHPQIPSNPLHWLVLAGMGSMATAGQLLMTTGFRYTSTVVGTVSKLAEPLLNLLVGFIALREVPPASFLVGAIFVVAGLSVMLRSRKAEVYNSNTVPV